MVAATREMTSDDAAFARVERSRTVVAGHYEVDLDEPLGSGGMAVVYRGRDLRTRRQVALKTLRPEYCRDPETRARFRREARTMAFLTHPNVARVYDLYEDDDAPWVVIEFVPGRSLKAELQRRGPFAIGETAGLLDQIADALDHLHGRELVHLDVKPQNLILTPEHTVKLIDFGLAQPAGAPQETIGGSTFGTVAYLAPEQARGESVSAATDVYALGCVVYELLTGRPPFGSDTPAPSPIKDDLIRAHLERDPPVPSAIRPELPAWVDHAVMRAMAKQPADRFRDCIAFARVVSEGTAEMVVAGDATTARIAALPTPEAAPVVAEPRRGNPVRSVGGGLYRTGGRMARHTGGLQRLLWRLTLAFLVGNVLLATLLYVDRGEVPGLIMGRATLEPGTTARVTIDESRLRAGPSTAENILVLLPLDHAVEIDAEGQTIDGAVWWPVLAEVDGVAYEGFVADGLLRPETASEGWIDGAIDRAKQVPNDLLERLGVPEAVRV